MHLSHLSQKQVESVIEAADAHNPPDETGSEQLVNLGDISPDEILKDSASKKVLTAHIDALGEKGRQEICALMWLGREEDPIDHFPELLANAWGMETGYIAAKWPLAQYLRRGLERLGYEPQV